MPSETTPAPAPDEPARGAVDSIDALDLSHFFAPLPWYVRLRWWLHDLARRAVCAVRGCRMEWHGGVVDWETGETDADLSCARCGRGEYDV